MKRPLPRGTLTQAVDQGEIARVHAEYVLECFPLQKEEAEAAKFIKRKQRGKRGPKPIEPYIRAAYAAKYPDGHGPISLKAMRDTLRNQIKEHFKIRTNIADKTFQRCGL
jgi:hypothetical protein